MNGVIDESGKVIISKCNLGIYEKHEKNEGFGVVIPTGEYGVGVFYQTKAENGVQYFSDLLSESTVAFSTDENGKIRPAMGGALDPHVDQDRVDGSVNAVVDRLIGLVPMQQVLPNIERLSKEELATVVKYFVATQGLKEDIEQALMNKLNAYSRKLREESNTNDMFKKIPVDDSDLIYNKIDDSLPIDNVIRK